MKSVYRTVKVEEAVGMVLPHDITQIIPDVKKGPLFRKGHVITENDIEKLKSVGKNHIYVLDIQKSEIHENDAALEMAPAFAGDGVCFDPVPSEGKISLKAEFNGLFTVKKEVLTSINMLGDVMMATLHADTPVKKGQTVAGLRAIPLVLDRGIVEAAVKMAEAAGNVIEVKPWIVSRAAIVVTGQEVYEGRIRDAFAPVITEKLKRFGIDIVKSDIAPDDINAIADLIEKALESGAELIICTGGMSVDPDDVTRLAIAKSGAKDIVYGSPVLPGAMFLAGYIDGTVPVLGIPACGMYYKTTVFDLVLPLVLAGVPVDRKKIASLGHGGLCLGCKKCNYPVCPFGKG